MSSSPCFLPSSICFVKCFYLSTWLIILTGSLLSSVYFVHRALINLLSYLPLVMAVFSSVSLCLWLSLFFSLSFSLSLFLSLSLSYTHTLLTPGPAVHREFGVLRLYCCTWTGRWLWVLRHLNVDNSVLPTHWNVQNVHDSWTETARQLYTGYRMTGRCRECWEDRDIVKGCRGIKRSGD